MISTNIEGESLDCLKYIPTMLWSKWELFKYLSPGSWDEGKINKQGPFELDLLTLTVISIRSIAISEYIL